MFFLYCVFRLFVVERAHFLAHPLTTLLCLAALFIDDGARCVQGVHVSLPPSCVCLCVFVVCVRCDVWCVLYVRWIGRAGCCQIMCGVCVAKCVGYFLFFGLFVVERVALLGSSAHHTSMFGCAVRPRRDSLRAVGEPPTLVCLLCVYLL